uniref:E3 ubiquitin-protein ligase n=1 Tax=Otolemur garnettii TaxID=30611 RepID=H0Y0B7_OTOGA
MSRRKNRARLAGHLQDPPPQREPDLSAATPSSGFLRSLLECPVCFDYVLPPIHQCRQGHLVCISCRQKLTSCPTCREPLGSIRNLVMDKVAYSLTFPCKYAVFGCGTTLSPAEKAEHEKVCDFKPYSCPCPNVLCPWEGSLDAVMPHLRRQHGSVTALEGQIAIFLATNINNVHGTYQWVMTQSCFDLHFMVVLQKQENYNGQEWFCAIVQLLGTSQQAANFTYQLELIGDRRRLAWKATPRSLREGIETAMMNGDCLVFDNNTAQLFVENDELRITVTIAKY